MKKIIYVSLIAGMLATSSLSQAEGGDYLTGDVKLACEAILCLSAGDRPSECAPSITKFFSIHDRKPWKTIQLRKDFLNLCPAAQEPGMPEYNDLLANNAEKCSADRLNKDLLEVKTRESCHGGNNETCNTYYYYRISNQLPSYCDAYFNHEYNQNKVKYSGSTDWVSQRDWNKGMHGRWVNSY